MKQDQRLTRDQKNKKKKAWYKEKATSIGILQGEVQGGVSDRRRMKVNYDLFNNILNLKDFEYVCQPFGAEAGELPAKMVNRDISAPKIKKVLGKAQKRPFNYKVVAVNPEATSRREQEEFGRIKEYVVGEIMAPIKAQAEKAALEAKQGKPLTPEQEKEIQAQIAEEVKANTPEETKEYMQRKHQDPAEIMSHQLLKYLTKKCDLPRKFNDALKHGLLSAKGVLYIGTLNGEPEVWNVNSIDFRYNKSPDTPFIEDGESAACTYRMTPSQILKYFGDTITDKKEIDRIYAAAGTVGTYEEEDLFSAAEQQDDLNVKGVLDVVHCVWKSLRKVGFLYYKDEAGEEQMDFVDESHTLNKDVGEIRVEWKWIPECYETWVVKTSEPIYTKMQPIPGQFKDLDNLYHCKLPYYGVVYDDMNSKETALMDRLKVYQYYYNIILYRAELLIASDKGKKVLMNINAIPDSAGMNIKQWQYFLESTPYMWYDNSEEGKGQQFDANTVAKVVDLSLISDIQKYMDMAEYIRVQAGRSVGIPDSLEGQINPRQSNQTTQEVIEQTSDILEPYYNLHDQLKKNVLMGLLETGIVAYSGKASVKLPYVLDDMSIEMLDIDMELLSMSKLGLFISEGGKTEEVLNTLKQLTHAAMQNQKIELSDVVSTLKKDNLSDAEAGLRASEEERFEREQASQTQSEKAAAQEAEKVRDREREKHQEDIDLIVIKEEERRKTVLAQAAITGASFNPDADADGNGENDFVELANQQLDNNLKMSAHQLDREKFEHQKQVDNKKIKQEDKKLKQKT